MEGEKGEAIPEPELKSESSIDDKTEDLEKVDSLQEEPNIVVNSDPGSCSVGTVQELSDEDASQAPPE